MTFADLLSYAEDLTLQQLIGTPVVRLLRLIDPALATPSRLRSLLTELRSPEDLLRDSTARAELISVLPQPEARELLAQLGGRATPNAYSELSRMRFQKNSATEAKMFSYFGVVPVPEQREEPTPETQELAPGYPLFIHQRKAARAAYQLLQSGTRRVLLHMPTGAGKTRTAMNVICDHLRLHEPTLVVWLAYSEELCEQAASEFERAWSLLGNRPAKIHRFWGARDLELNLAKDGLLVAGLAKVYNGAKASIEWLATLADQTSLVVIDEAHQAIAETYRLVLNGLEIKQASTSLLGLTATPGRTWNDLDQDEKLARFFSRRKVTLEVVGADNPVNFLIQEGYLARPRFVRLHHSGAVNLDARDQRELAEALDIPQRVLRKFAEDEQRNLAIVHRIEELTRRHLRILVFSATVEHAKLLAVVLRARGIDAQAVTGTTPGFERQRHIQHFRSAKPEPIVLCNYGVLTTGFDAPKTSAAVIARPTKSLVLYNQMLGRAIRGPLAGGNREAEVVTVVDASLPGFGDLGEAFLNWEDVWA